MPQNQNIGELPERLLRLLTSLTGDYSKDWDKIESIAAEAELQMEDRYETSIMLLSALDLVEICVQKSMVSSQKLEFGWRLSHLYLRMLSTLLAKAADHSDGSGIDGQFPYLLAKVKYELERRKTVLANGGLHELEPMLAAVKHLL